MEYRFNVIDPEADTRWDDFVYKSSEGLIYHHSAWKKVLEATYGFKPYYFAFEQLGGEKIVGIVPLMLADSCLTGKRLVSLPFTSYCNPIIKKDMLNDAVTFMYQQHLDVQYIEFKTISDTYKKLPEIFSKTDDFVTHILDVDMPLKELFMSFHTSSIRQRVKRAKRENLSIRLGETEHDLKIFYKLETAVRKRHGLPPPPFKFFLNMWRILRPRGMLFLPVVEYKKKVLASAVVLTFKDKFHFEYSAADRRYSNLCANQLLIWETIKMAVDRKAKYFDFGRSSLTNNSLIEFKERWQAKRKKLIYLYYPQNKKQKIAVGFWRHCLEKVNKKLPAKLLKIQGNIIYPHLS